MKLFAENNLVKPAFLADAASGAAGARIGIKGSNKCAFVIQINTGSATTLVATLRQHDDAAAGNSADIVSTVPHYVKADADAQYTRVDGSVAALAIADLDTAKGIVIVEVNYDDLIEGYEFVSIELATSGDAGVRIASIECMLDTSFKPAYRA